MWIAEAHVHVDGGRMTVPAFGAAHVDGAEWLIEGRGIEPDVVVDNLPVETSQGRDAQLETAVALLLEKINAEPMAAPQRPPAIRR